ncbi:MAG: DUF4197 domain-containing protein [Pseudomonadota bacterium]
MRAILAGALALCLFPAGCETADLEQFGEVFGEVVGGTDGADGLSGSEVEAGLRQALTIGTERVAGQIGVTDGYWQDPQIRIPLPGRLGEAQEQLGRFGLSGPLDDLQLRMNRAAEDAVPAGKRIVIDAVQSITIQDAFSILNGGDSAATDFLRGRTEASLRTTFTPFVEDALQSSGAYQTLDSVTSSQPLLQAYAGNFKSDLTTHAVNFGLNGLFNYLAVEEKKIRDNPVARTTELLRRVFGSR